MKMYQRNLIGTICILLLTVQASVSEEDSFERSKKSDDNEPSSFEKRQGLLLMEGMQDQIAMESSHQDQIAIETSHHGNPIPVPVPIDGNPGTVILPLPPNLHQQQQQQQHSNEYYGQQQQHGQFTQQQNVVQNPPQNFNRFPPQQSQNYGPPSAQHQNPQFQKQHQQLISHVQQSRPQNAPEIYIQNQQPVNPGQQLHQPQYRPPQSQRHQGGNYASSEVTKNILRELFEKRPQPPPVTQKHNVHMNPFTRGNAPAPNGGYFGPAQAPGASHPKIMNPGIPDKAHALATNDLHAEGQSLAPQYGPPGPTGGQDNGLWPNSGPSSDMPKIVTLEVKCEKNVMRVFVAFDKPFFGVIFSKGHYHNVQCIHLPAGLGHTSANFDIGIDACGTNGNTENGLYGYGQDTGSGSFYENTIIIQYDPQVQEVWDQARKLRCTWHDQYEKSVTFRPFSVDMLDVVRADFAGDNVGCWMQIQVGKGPWASEVSGLVKIGQTMTMVLAIKDDDNKFDMMVRNCVAHDGNRAPIQLVDQWGCINRPKLMSRFTKIKNFGPSATVLSYAHFQAFKFPDSMEVHFQCTIQICRHQCPEQCSQGDNAVNNNNIAYGKSGLVDSQELNRAKRRIPRSLNSTELMDDSEVIYEYETTFKTALTNEDIGLNKVITVVSPEDLDFSQQKEDDNESATSVPVIEASIGDIVCMSTFGFASMLTVVIGMLLFACVISAVLIVKRPKLSSRNKNMYY